MLRYNLERAGYRVLPKFDGAEAIRSVPIEQPDLLLLDVMLPGADGRDVCRSCGDIPLPGCGVW